jgi:hypothetical protein
LDDIKSTSQLTEVLASCHQKVIKLAFITRHPSSGALVTTEKPQHIASQLSRLVCDMLGHRRCRWKLRQGRERRTLNCGKTPNFWRHRGVCLAV